MSRQVLSVIRRALEAGPPEPEGEELVDQAMRGWGASDQESLDNRIPRGTLLTEGEEMTHQGTRGTHGTCGKCRCQRRKVRNELKTQTQEGSRPIPATGGRQGAERDLEAQAGTSERDGTPEESVTPRPKGESLSADERRDQGLSTRKTPRRGAPPGHGPPPGPCPAFGAMEGRSCVRDDSHDQGEYGRREVPMSRTSGRR